MTTRSIPLHRTTVGRMTRVPGYDVDLVRVKVGDMLGWRLVVEGEPWIAAEVSNRRWQGYSEDHLTGTPRLHRLFHVVRWIHENRSEWAAKLRVRREQETRMVDPKHEQHRGAH